MIRSDEEMGVSKDIVKKRSMGRVVCSMAAVSVLLVGCGKSDHPETAQDTFKAYLRHVYLNKDTEAFELVAPQDRARLITLQKELESAGVSKTYEPHETLLVRAIVNPYALKSVEIDAADEASQKPDEALLRYTLVDGQQGEARMVRGGEDNRWYLKVLP